jgi:uncharacterized iron-regulated membrane protein
MELARLADPRLEEKGRSFNWDLHAVAGTWCLLFYWPP